MSVLLTDFSPGLAHTGRASLEGGGCYASPVTWALLLSSKTKGSQETVTFFINVFFHLTHHPNLSGADQVLGLPLPSARQCSPSESEPSEARG